MKGSKKFEPFSVWKILELVLKITSALRFPLHISIYFLYLKYYKLLRHPDFIKQKIGVLVATFDKAFYNKKDIEDLNQLKEFITTSFNQRGELTTKKQLLSSKEKEVWNCECGSKSIDIGEYCVSCNNNLFGFKQNEMKPIDAVNFIAQKIELINEYVV